jgi:hypothetical protein
VLAISVAVVETSFGTTLMTSARSPNATSSRCYAALVPAVSIAAVARSAQEEDFLAFAASNEPS